MSHIVIRADGGPDIGYGHIVRSNALADELRSRGHSVTYATATPSAVDEIVDEPVTVEKLPDRDDPSPFIDYLVASNPDAVYTDSYPVDTEYQRAIHDKTRLAVWQDDARHVVCADLFANGNLYGNDLEYEFVGPKPQTLLGPDFVPLRRAVREYASEEPPWRDQPERAIVTMGGSDVAGLTPRVARAFDGSDLRVDAIVGPGVSQDCERVISEAADEVSANIVVTRDPDDLVERMFQADFAVSTASSSTYELMALGTPIISVPVANNQRLIAAALQEREAATVLERGPDEEAFHEAIDDYVMNGELRYKRRERGRELVDGQGVVWTADRVLKTVVQ